MRSDIDDYHTRGKTFRSSSERDPNPDMLMLGVIVGVPAVGVYVLYLIYQLF